MDTQDLENILDDSMGIMLKELKLYGLDIHGKGSDDFELARKIYMTAKHTLIGPDWFRRGHIHAELDDLLDIHTRILGQS